jgi:hypothetical protein
MPIGMGVTRFRMEQQANSVREMIMVVTIQGKQSNVLFQDDEIKGR